jgi:hypothetical protein
MIVMDFHSFLLYSFDCTVRACRLILFRQIVIHGARQADK